MRRSLPHRKCVCSWFLWLALGAATVFGDIGAEVTKRAAEYGRTMTAARNRQALEAYEKRNAEITPWTEDAALANTNNAALLYYQAFLFRPEPNEAIKYKIRPNAGPTPQIRTYLGHCLPVIEMVETASRIPECNWAVWPNGGPSRALLRRNIGLITDILLVDAGTLAVDGHYRVALDRCLTVRRLARHLSDDPELYRYERGPDTLALYTIKIVLGMMPPDADILTWSRGQFAVVPGPRLSYARTLKAYVRVDLNNMRANHNSIQVCKDLAVKEAAGQSEKENIRNLTNEQFISRARDGLARFTDSVLLILDSEATYEEKLAQMHRAVVEKMEDDATDPLAKAIASRPCVHLRGLINMTYPLHVEHVALINATKAAVEIYLVLAKTGKLPKEIPDHLPKDPFTGKDFGYEITDEGFALRCQGKELLTRKKSLLEFKVRE